MAIQKKRHIAVKKPNQFVMKLDEVKSSIGILANALGNLLTEDQLDKFSKYVFKDAVDSRKPIAFYLTEAPLPIGKDQQRIYDIIKKSLIGDDQKVIISRADFIKMSKLACAMNGKIKDNVKRTARKDACLFYGLTDLALCFDDKDYGKMLEEVQPVDKIHQMKVKKTNFMDDIDFDELLKDLDMIPTRHIDE